MLNITHYQRNANQNHYEVPFHSSQNGCDPKVYKLDAVIMDDFLFFFSLTCIFWTSQVVLVVKNPPANAGEVNSL